MARRKATRRRRNPLRSVGTLLINPRPKRRRSVRKKRRKNPARKRRSTASRRKNPSKRRKSKNPPKGYRRVRRRTRRKARARKHYYRKSNPRKRRRAPRVAARRRRNGISRRRNPAFVQGIAKSVSKIPVVGKPLAKIVSFAPHMAIGAVAVEAPLQLSKWVATQEWVPQFIKDMSQPAYFATIGAVLGLGAMYFFPGSTETKKRVAIALASGCAGAAYYQWRADAHAGTTQGLGSVMLSGVGSYGAMGMGPDYGAVGLSGMDYGTAPAYTVDSGWGAVAIGS